MQMDAPYATLQQVDSANSQTPPQPSDFSFAALRRTLFCALLILATVAVYFPTLHNGFVNYDDPGYIVHNPHLQSGLTWQTIRWAATAYYQSNWHPLTWISHALDISVFHLNPAGHHAVGFLMHALNTLLLFFVLQDATGRDWESFFVAALFAVHPVNIESVAWASERKNVLSAFFLLLTLLAYGKYAERPSISRYLIVAITYTLGLAAKPQIITLPFLLLLWDFWPLDRWNPFRSSSENTGSTTRQTFRRLCIEKVPLLALSAASAVITMKAQIAGGALQAANAAGRTVAAYSLSVRLENAVVAYARYIEMMLWPVGLAPMYPHPGNGIGTVSVLFSAVLLAVITAIVLVTRRHRYLPVGWFLFLGSLVPMIGIVQVGSQAMADRYAYLPYIGLFCMVVWGISEAVSDRPESKKLVTVGAVTALVIFGVLAHRQVGFWKNSETLWKQTLQVTAENFVAHDSLAEVLLDQDRFPEACSQFQSSVKIFPDDMPAQEGLAVCAQARGDAKEAIERYKNVLKLAAEPSIRATAFANLGSIYRELHDYETSTQNYGSALKLNPDLPIALVGTGLLAQKGWDYSRAAEQYAHAMRVAPTSVGYLLLAKALEQSGRSLEAKDALEKAQKLSRNLEGDQKIADALLAQ
jgi:tetratricopeptide (TPR) repeat protein